MHGECIPQEFVVKSLLASAILPLFVAFGTLGLVNQLAFPTPAPAPSLAQERASLPTATMRPAATIPPPTATVPPRSIAALPAVTPTAALPTATPDLIEAWSAPASLPAATPDPRAGCDPAYPEERTCIPPGPPFDQGCAITSERLFEVLPPDPQRLDHDNDGIGCEPI